LIFAGKFLGCVGSIKISAKKYGIESTQTNISKLDSGASEPGPVQLYFCHFLFFSLFFFLLSNLAG